MRFVKKELNTIWYQRDAVCFHSGIFWFWYGLNKNKKQYSKRPTICAWAMAAMVNPIKTYVDYKQAIVTRIGLDKKGISSKTEIRLMCLNISCMRKWFKLNVTGNPGVSTSLITREMMESLFVDSMPMRMISIVMGFVKADNTTQYRNVERLKYQRDQLCALWTKFRRWRD